MKRIDLNISIDLSGVAAQYKDLFTIAIKKGQPVWESQEFVDCLDKRIKGYKIRLQGENSKWKTATATEIVDQLFAVVNGKGSTKFMIKTYYSIKRVIGFGVASDDFINVNTKYLSAYSEKDLFDLMAVDSNLTHEQGHNRGFDHDFDATADRDNSICYLLNKAFEDAYKILVINATATPEPVIVPTPVVPEKPVVITPTPNKKRVCYKPWYYFITRKEICHYE